MVYLSKVERHVHVSIGVYEFDSVVIGQHVYKREYGPHSLMKV